MKLRPPYNWHELRQRLVFTLEEKRVIAFVIAALLLGLGTKCYRDKHPQPVPYTDPKQLWRKNLTPPPPAPAKPTRPRKPSTRTPPPRHATATQPPSG